MKNSGQEDLLRLSRNFMESRVLLSGAELRLFTILSRETLSAPELAARTGAEVRPLTILLDALAAMGLLEKRNGAYGCPESLSRLLSEDSPGTIAPMILHTANLWPRWSGLTDIVKGGKDAAKSMAAPFQDASELKAFIGAMHVVAEPLAPKIVAAVRPGTARSLLDVGGASGTYTIAFLEAVPGMRATLFDRPPVIEMARERLGKAGLLDRVTLAAGDFYGDEFPPGHDLAFVSAIIHQNSTAQNIDLYGKIFRSLERGGRIVIRDHIMAPDRTRPRSGTLFAVNMLVGTAGGNTYTFEEIQGDLTRSGFTRIALLKEGENMDGLIEAFRP